MKPTKSLQKFTKSENKINKLLSFEQITPIDLEQLNETERKQLMETLTERFNSLKGTERDKFYKKIELITSETTKNQLWEINHTNITCAISNLMQEYGRMPSKTEIATRTELSRQTIHKHLKEYKTHSQYLIQNEQFAFMTDKVLAKVFQFAVNGDIGAAKLFFNIVGLNNSSQQINNTMIQNQNNYIQINGVVLSQDTISKLNEEQLRNVEELILTYINK